MPPLVRRCRPLLGTFVEVAVEPGGETAVEAAFAAVAHVQAVMSFHDAGSDLGRLRTAPAGTAVPVDAETMAVLQLAETLFKWSGGLFNVGVGRALVADGLLPAQPGPTRFTGDAAHIELLDDRTVRCRRPTLIDLGGIAKGHAVDLATSALRARGVSRAIINAGGDLRVLGHTGQPVHIRGRGGVVDGYVVLTDGALATSCNADASPAQVSHRDGNGHPLPYPGVVVAAAPTCALADAATKIAFADPALAAGLLAEHGGALLAPAWNSAAGLVA